MFSEYVIASWSMDADLTNSARLMQCAKKGGQVHVASRIHCHCRDTWVDCGQTRPSLQIQIVSGVQVSYQSSQPRH